MFSVFICEAKKAPGNHQLFFFCYLIPTDKLFGVNGGYRPQCHLLDGARYLLLKYSKLNSINNSVLKIEKKIQTN